MFKALEQIRLNSLEMKAIRGGKMVRCMEETCACTCCGTIDTDEPRDSNYKKLNPSQ